MTTPYTTGTITLTNNSAIVTGVGTAWKTALIAGGVISPAAPGGNALPISSVDSDTRITAAIPWRGASGTYSYALTRDTAYGEQTVANAQALAEYLARLDKPTLTALAALSGTMAADKIAYAVGQNSMQWTALTSLARSLLDDDSTAKMRETINVAHFDNGRLEVGGARATEGVAFVDLTSLPGRDYDARLLRQSGVDGTLDLVQTGNGIIRIIGGSGLQYNGNSILTAANSSGVFGDSGWAKLPGRLLVQWGHPTITPNSYGEATILLPTAFSAANLYSVLASRSDAGPQAMDTYARFVGRTATSFVVRASNASTGAPYGGATIRVDYIAVGAAP